MICLLLDENDHLSKFVGKVLNSSIAYSKIYEIFHEFNSDIITGGNFENVTNITFMAQVHDGQILILQNGVAFNVFLRCCKVTTHIFDSLLSCECYKTESMYKVRLIRVVYGIDSNNQIYLYLTDQIQ